MSALLIYDLFLCVTVRY